MAFTVPGETTKTRGDSCSQEWQIWSGSSDVDNIPSSSSHPRLRARISHFLKHCAISGQYGPNPIDFATAEKHRQKHDQTTNLLEEKIQRNIGMIIASSVRNLDSGIGRSLAIGYPAPAWRKRNTGALNVSTSYVLLSDPGDSLNGKHEHVDIA